MCRILKAYTTISMGEIKISDSDMSSDLRGEPIQCPIRM